MRGNKALRRAAELSPDAVERLQTRRPIDPVDEWLDITPDIAADWLSGPTHNRPLSWVKVSRYAKLMKDGKWTTHHQGMAFDAKGRLIDGQHRLWAIIESGCTIRIRVSRNVSTREGVDEGTPIAPHHALSLRNGGDRITQTELAVLKRVLKGNGPWLKLSRADLEVEWDKLGRYVRRAINCFSDRQAHLFSPATVAPLAIVLISKLAEEADLWRFANQLTTGITDDESVSRLRETILGRRASANVIFNMTSSALSDFIA